MPKRKSKTTVDYATGELGLVTLPADDGSVRVFVGYVEKVNGAYVPKSTLQDVTNSFMQAMQSLLARGPGTIKKDGVPAFKVKMVKIKAELK